MKRKVRRKYCKKSRLLTERKTTRDMRYIRYIFKIKKEQKCNSLGSNDCP